MCRQLPRAGGYCAQSAAADDHKLLHSEPGRGRHPGGDRGGPARSPQLPGPPTSLPGLCVHKLHRRGLHSGQILFLILILYFITNRQ